MICKKYFVRSKIFVTLYSLRKTYVMKAHYFLSLSHFLRMSTIVSVTIPLTVRKLPIAISFNNSYNCNDRTLPISNCFISSGCSISCYCSGNFGHFGIALSFSTNLANLYSLNVRSWVRTQVYFCVHNSKLYGFFTVTNIIMLL